MRKGIAGSEVTISVDETYYKGMLDVLPERVIRFRLPDLTILYCNAAWSSSHHLTPAEAIGRTMDELLSPAARADLELQLVQLSPENTLARDPDGAPCAQRSRPMARMGRSISAECRGSRGPRRRA